MKQLINALCLTALFAIASAPAQARPLTRTMTCEQAQALLARQGAIVLDTDKYIYDRYVANRSFCPITQATEPAWVPTKNNPQCFIGYTCTEDLDWPD